MTIASLFMVDIDSPTLDSATADFLVSHQIRAVCLFRRNCIDAAQTAQLVADLSALMGPDALIAIDQEGGRVIRANFLPQAPAAMAFAALPDRQQASKWAYEVGAANARGLRSLGINWNFAPVLDVNNNLRNPVIGARSFGMDVATVSELALAYSQGCWQAGVATCVKHFPGHGDTHLDSHFALPTVDKSLAQLDALELAPFRHLCLTGNAPALMSAHICYPQIDAQYPATLSKRWLTDLLRQEWGYQGVIATDAFSMAAIKAHYGFGAASVMALAAGADCILALGSRAEQIEALNAAQCALAEGRLVPAHIAQSQLRLQQLAQRFPARIRPYPEETQDIDLMRQVWRMALCCSPNARPPKPKQAIRLIAQARVAATGVSDQGVDGAQFAALLAQDFPAIELLLLDDLSRDLPTLSWPNDQAFNLLISNIKTPYPADWRNHQSLPIDLQVALSNPFHALHLPVPSLVSWGDNPEAQRAIRDWLCGDLQAQGRLPWTQPAVS